MHLYTVVGLRHPRLEVYNINNDADAKDDDDDKNNDNDNNNNGRTNNIIVL